MGASNKGWVGKQVIFEHIRYDTIEEINVAQCFYRPISKTVGNASKVTIND